MPTYPPTISTLANGEKVDAGITNRPTNQLIERTDYLKARLDALADSLEVLTSFDQPVADSVLDSQLAYYNTATGKYELALAELAAAGAPPVFTPTDRNNVVGIAVNIRGIPGSKIADLLLSGRIKSARLTQANLLETTAVLDPGKTLFLSVNAGEEGRCSSNTPILRVAVGWFENDGSLVLDPDARSLGEDHIHYNFALDNSKWVDLGGAVPLTGVPTFTTTSQNVTGVGTLFLTEVSPGDAIQLTADGLLYQVDSVTSNVLLVLTVPYAGAGGAGASTVATGPWLYPGTELEPFPPIPFQSTVLIVNGHTFEYDDEYTVDTSGVHLEIFAGPPTEDGLFDAQLFYTFPLGASAPGVTRLKTGTANVRIANCSIGGPPDTGDLKISVIDLIEIVSQTVVSGKAIKSLGVNPSTGVFEVQLGPVVEQILVGGGLAVTGGGTGQIVINATGASSRLDHIPHIVLRNAKEVVQSLTSYIQFPEGVNAGFFGKIRLDDNIDVSTSLDLVFEMLGEKSISTTALNAQFQLEYYIVDVAASQSLNKSKTIASATIDFPLPYTAYTTFSAVAFQIPGSQLVPGGTLALFIKRLEAADTYTGAVGVLHPLYRIGLT